MCLRQVRTLSCGHLFVFQNTRSRPIVSWLNLLVEWASQVGPPSSSHLSDSYGVQLTFMHEWSTTSGLFFSWSYNMNASECRPPSRPGSRGLVALLQPCMKLVMLTVRLQWSCIDYYCMVMILKCPFREIILRQNTVIIAYLTTTIMSFCVIKNSYIYES